MLCAFAFLLLAPTVRALEIPDLRAHVLDRAGLLRAEDARALEARLVEFERTKGHQVVVHITPSLEQLEIEDYSIQIAESWKVGQRGLDNGVILTVAPNERQVRIEVGYGLEGVLPDVIAARIIREWILPEFRAGRMDRGVEAGTRAILDRISGEDLPVPSRGEGQGAPLWVVGLWIAFVVGTMLLRGFFFAPAFGGPRTRHRGGTGGVFPRGGGFGGGGFSGGGGGFGGGGASGRW